MMDIFDGNDRIVKPYGSNEGDIWAMGGRVGEMLEAKGMIGITEMLRNPETGEVEERIYSVELNNPDPEMQDIIKRARAGAELKLQFEAAMN